MFCKVYIFDVPYHIDRPFDYSCDDGIAVGSIVKVPFGKSDKLRLGVVSAVTPVTESEKIKPVHSVVHDRFSMNEEMLGLCLFMKKYTLCTFGEAARCILPPGALAEHLNIKYKYICRLAVSAEELSAILCAKGREGIRSIGQRAVL